MSDVMLKQDLIAEISERSDFNYSDSAWFLDILVEILEDCVEHGVEMKIRELGILSITDIPERKSSSKLGSKILPPTKRVNFRLSDNIRNKAK